MIDPKTHKALAKILHDPANGLQGYKELKQWYEKKTGRSIKYITLVKYCQRHFNTKIKVARKSHINKDEQEVISFKKTLVTS